MVGEIKEELTRLWNLIFMSLTVVSVVLGIMKKLPIEYMSILLLSLVIVYLFHYIYRLRTRLQENPPPTTIQLLRENIPKEIEFFVDFFASTILHEDILTHIKFIDKNLHVTKFTKNFTVKQQDCITEQIYEVVNASIHTHANEIYVVTYGGSSLEV